MSNGFFAKAIENHVIEVLRDDCGVNRHIRFRRPGTMCMHFDLVTWPGHLCYTGDMGTFVFRRLHDMFEFFRIPKERPIDYRYWAEKLLAVDASGGKGSATEFSYARFTAVIKEYLHRWIREDRGYYNLDKNDRRDLYNIVLEEVLDGEEDEHYAFQRAHDFRWVPLRQKNNRRVYAFNDLWDYQFTEYTHSFTWCCEAIAWGIRKFDESKP